MRPRTPVMDFLRTEGGLTFLVVSLVLFIFVLFPVAEYLSRPTKYLLSLAFSLVLIASTMAVFERQGYRSVAIALAAIALGTHWANQLLQTVTSRLVTDVAVTVFMAVTVIALLGRVLMPGRVTYHRIAGAISAYLLIGMLWAEIYGLIEFLIPGSFNVGGSPITDHADFSGVLLYYSFVTLTTLGYGDITPVNILARQISVLESVIGVVFLATLIATLVSRQSALRNAGD